MSYTSIKEWLMERPWFNGLLGVGGGTTSALTSNAYANWQTQLDFIFYILAKLGFLCGVITAVFTMLIAIRNWRNKNGDKK